MATFKYKNFKDYADQENKQGLIGKIATHHMKLYQLISAMQKPTIVEMGVDKGQSTCILLTACEKVNGRCFSIDINDCSDVAKSDAWIFVQSDDRNVKKILQQAPLIKEGIDLLHIDSLHTGEHIAELLMKWYPYIKKNSYITFHDVDNTPYKPGQRKANPKVAEDHAELCKAIREFFYANEDDLFLEYHFGSTGMGIMKKLVPMGTEPKKPCSIPSWPIGIIASVKCFWKSMKSQRW